MFSFGCHCFWGPKTCKLCRICRSSGTMTDVLGLIFCLLHSVSMYSKKGYEWENDFVSFIWWYIQKRIWIGLCFFGLIDVTFLYLIVHVSTYPKKKINKRFFVSLIWCYMCLLNLRRIWIEISFVLYLFDFIVIIIIVSSIFMLHSSVWSYMRLLIQKNIIRRIVFSLHHLMLHVSTYLFMIAYIGMFLSSFLHQNSFSKIHNVFKITA